MKKEALEFAKYIEKHDKIALFHHNNIDGDSFSSSYGLALALKKHFPQKEIKFLANLPEIKENFPHLEVKENMVCQEIDSTWLAIVGDTSSKSKLDHLDQINKAGVVIVFDHHQNDIEIRHDYFWHEPSYPASTIQAIEIAYVLGVYINEEIAFNLMIGLLTDTNNFVYSLANPLPVKMYSEMLEFISDEKMDQFWNKFRSIKKADVEVKGALLNNLKFYGKVAYVHFDQEKIKRIADANFKRYIYEIGNIENYPIWCIFNHYEKDNKDYLKLHFRSNGPDVSKIAIKYGGGGHKRAAGATVEYTPNTIEKILSELNKIA